MWVSAKLFPLLLNLLLRVCFQLCSPQPKLKWAQRKDKVYHTLLFGDAKDTTASLEPEGVFTFSATANGENPWVKITCTK